MDKMTETATKPSETVRDRHALPRYKGPEVLLRELFGPPVNSPKSAEDTSCPEYTEQQIKDYCEKLENMPLSKGILRDGLQIIRQLQGEAKEAEEIANELRCELMDLHDR